MPYIFLDRFVFKLGKLLSIITVTVICLFPLIGRALAIENVIAPMPWGFCRTATHLHYDAIAYGVLAAYIFHKRFSILNKLNGIAGLFACVLLAVSAVSIHFANYQLEYEFAPMIVGLLSAIAILCLAEGPQYNFSSNNVVKLLAKTSFSIYLAHGIALHTVNIGLKYIVFLDSTSLRFILMTAASIASGFIFYGLIEKPLNVKRDVLLTNLFPIKA